MDEGNKKSNKCGLSEILGYILVFVCGVALIVVLFFYFCRTCQKEYTIQQHHVELDFSNVGNSTTDKSRTVEISNLDEILDSIKYALSSYDTRIESKYQYFIEQKDSANDLLKLAGVLFSIIAALVGYFGFKNFKSIEEKALSLAEFKAEEVAEQKAEKVAKQKAEEVAEQKAEKVAEQKAEEVAEQKAEEVAEQKAEEVAEKVAEQKAEEVAEQKAEEVAKNKVESRVKEFVDQQFIGEKVDDLVNSVIAKLDIDTKVEQQMNSDEFKRMLTQIIRSYVKEDPLNPETVVPENQPPSDDTKMF